MKSKNPFIRTDKVNMASSKSNMASSKSHMTSNKSHMTSNKSNMASNKSNKASLVSLPYEDIICKHIFSLLTLKELINVHDAHKILKSMVTWYLENYCTDFDFQHVGRNLSKKFLNIIKHKRNIKSLSFGGRFLMKEEEVVSVIEKNKQLTKLNLSNSILFIDECHLLQILKTVQNLRYIEIACELFCYDIYKLSDDTMSILTTNNKSLEYFILSDHFKITDIGYSYLADNLHRLKHLDIPGQWTITDNNIIPILANNKNLQHLNVSGCKSLTSETWKSVSILI